MSKKSERDFENDVWYEVWQRGGNPDLIDDDRVSDYYHDSYCSDILDAMDCGSRELHFQKRRRD